MCENRYKQNEKTHELMWRMVIEQGRMVAATVFIASVGLIGNGVSLFEPKSYFRLIGSIILFLIGGIAMWWSIAYYRKQK